MVRQADRREAGTDSGVSEPEKTYLICTVHGGLVGFDVNIVRHIGTTGRIWRIPLVPNSVKGVTRIRDRLVPLVDLRLQLGLPEAAYHERTCVVEIGTAAPIAVAVDSVEGVRRFSEVDIVPTSRLRMGGGSRAVRGIVPIEDRLCVLLNLEWALLGRTAKARDVYQREVVPRKVCEDRSFEVFQTDAVAGGEEAVTPAAPVSTVTDQVTGDAVPWAPNPDDETIHALLRFDSGPLREPAPEPGLTPISNQSREARLLGLLAQPAYVEGRRVPGFRKGDPRLPALAVALLEMPAVFQTRDAAPAVAGLLDRSPEDYRVNHFRYDLAKLRARHLAARIGVSRDYRLTKIGRMVCEVLERGSAAANLPQPRVTIPLRSGVPALSA